IKRIPIANGYPSVYFSSPADVKGMIPLVTIVAGQAITSNEVVKASQALGSQSEFLPIPSGYVAVTIPTSEQQEVADYIQPNDYISVIAIVSSNGKVASKTIFTNIHVIKVGTNGSAAGSASVTSLIRTLSDRLSGEALWTARTTRTRPVRRPLPPAARSLPPLRSAER